MSKEAKELEGKLGKYLEKYREESNKCEQVFHYTDCKGFKGILSSRQFWFTNHKFLNDPSEIMHGIKIIQNCVEKHCKNYCLNFDIKEFLKNSKERLANYLVAFSKEGDSLPLWRHYGGNGAGFSIGLKKKFFMPNKKTIPENEQIHFFKIEYEAQMANKIVNDMLGIADNCCDSWKEKSRNEIPHGFLTILFSHLFTLLPQLKHPDFEYEDEYRLCISVWQMGLMI